MDYEIKRTSEEWSKLLGALVKDPDGWDRRNFNESWSEHITKEEFDRRLQQSTIDSRGYPTWYEPQTKQSL